MASTFTTAVILVTFGLLSLVTARPTASHQQNVDEQGYYTFFPQQQAAKNLEEQADAATVDQIVDAYNDYVKQLQGNTFPQEQSAEKQGSITWDWAKKQASQLAKEEGITFTPPRSWGTQQAKGQGITLDLPYSAKEQGRTVRLPQMQGIRVPGLVGNEQGLTFTYPQNQWSSSAKEEGRTVRLPQMQGIRVPGLVGNEQGLTFTYPQNQWSSSAKEQGRTVRLPQTQGIRVPRGWVGNKQGITIPYPQTQRIYGEQFGSAKEQTPVSYQQINLTAAIDIIGALCGSRASYPEKLLDELKVGQYTLGDLLSKACDK